MAVKLGEWKAEWLRMKQQFETETGKKKPTKTFLGFRKKSGVATAFGKMDDAYKAWSTAKIPDRPKFVKPFVKAVAAARKEGDDYIAILDKAAKDEASKDDILALLKIMKKDIKACLTQAEAQVVMMQEAMKDDGTLDPKAMRSVKVLKATLEGTLKKATLWISQQARKPDAEAFNADINTVTRDVTQNLKNLWKIYEKAPDGKELHKCLVPLEAWSNKGRKVAKDADEAAVKKELALLHGVIKRTSGAIKNLKELA